MEWPIPVETLSRPAEEPERIREPGKAFFRKDANGQEPLGIIGCSENASAPEWQGRRRYIGRAILLAVAALALLFAGAVAYLKFAGDDRRADSAEAAAVAAQVVSLPPPDLLRPLTPQEATKENAERPFVDRPDSAASRFVLHANGDSRERALTCLTQAVYYEAASEGVDGGRAVAQVVLNRMRHPGYPSSVCGVVYQGSDRATGCQFTFTCDGSLLRQPVASLWARSRKIAQEALAGKVFAPVGHATSYHADYVLPYWADSLDKTVQIGRHIFYRLRGTVGDRRSFFQRYAGAEPLLPEPKKPETVLPATADAAQLATALISDGVKAPTPEVEKAGGPAIPLAVDATPSTLIIDGEAPAAGPAKTKAKHECKAGADSHQLSPLGANDMRSAASSTDC